MKKNKRSSGKNEYIHIVVLLVLAFCSMAGIYFGFESAAVKMIIFLIAALGFTVLLSMLIQKHKQIKRLSEILKISSGREHIQKKAMTDKLENCLSDLLCERNELVHKVETMEQQFRIRAVTELLEGKPMDDEVSNLLPQFNGAYSILFVAYSKESFSEIKKTGVKEIAKDLFSEIANIHFAENQTGGALWMIAVFKASSDSLKDDIEKISRKFINSLKSDLNIDADVIYGRITENKDEISDVYREVKDAAFLSQKDGCIIDAEKIAKRDYDVYNYSIDTEISIIIYIKKGDFARAYGLIRNALDEILYQRSYPIYIIRCFMFEIAGTILKAIGETEKENGISLGCSKKLNDIFFTDSVIEMEHILKEYLKEVCECIAENNKGVASPFCEKIKQYVRENYADADMNVNAIAARFYINPAYLSNMFKRNTDIKLLDYINKVRVDEAKRMIIANPEITIEELSEKSGFKNSRTFRRIFLKHENISPSKFARM